jgi:hypothetical protein
VSDELPTATRIAALDDQVYRLTAENVRLTNEAGELRAALDASRAREEAYRADVVMLTKACDGYSRDVVSALKDLARERSRASVLEAALVSARDSFIHIAEYWNGSDNDKAVADALDVMGSDANDAAIAAGNALDAGKFEGKP